MNTKCFQFWNIHKKFTFFLCYLSSSSILFIYFSFALIAISQLLLIVVFKTTHGLTSHERLTSTSQISEYNWNIYYEYVIYEKWWSCWVWYSVFGYYYLCLYAFLMVMVMVTYIFVISAVVVICNVSFSFSYFSPILAFIQFFEKFEKDKLKESFFTMSNMPDMWISNMNIWVVVCVFRSFSCHILFILASHSLIQSRSELFSVAI